MKYHGAERREANPVDIIHWPPGAKIGLVSILIALVLNILFTGMAYQKIVDNVSTNTEAIRSLRTVDVSLMGAINDMTKAVATLTATIDYLAVDVRRMEDDR